MPKLINENLGTRSKLFKSEHNMKIVATIW